MSGYIGVNLREMIDEIGEDDVRNILSDYYCPLNKDVEMFLKIALDKVRLFHSIVGGRIVYLECEEQEYLLDFYDRNGFVNFGKRPLEGDESDVFRGKYLIQLLKYVK